MITSCMSEVLQGNCLQTIQLQRTQCTLSDYPYDFLLANLSLLLTATLTVHTLTVCTMLHTYTLLL